MRKETFAALLLMGSSLVALAGCGASEDGPQLSDQEKIDIANKGRQNYNNGASNGAPAPSTDAAAPAPGR